MHLMKPRIRKKWAVTRKAVAKMTPEQWQARFAAAAEEAQREYCDIFKFWRTCHDDECRRMKACRGDQLACLRQGRDAVAPLVQHRALQQVIAATPADADRPTCLARSFHPSVF
jgi:hypothetical protein